MKYYNTYNPGWFNTTKAEVDALVDSPKFNLDKYQRNMSAIVAKYGQNIVGFTIKVLPEKRTRWDNACLLVVKLDDGAYKAKRHNNSQWINLV